MQYDKNKEILIEILSNSNIIYQWLRIFKIHMDSLDSTKPYSMWRNTTNIWLMRQVFVKFVHSKPRFIDCFPPAYHNSFSVGLKRCLSCYKYHFNGYKISSWQRKWFSIHSSYENGLLLALYISFVTLKRVWDWFLWSQWQELSIDVADWFV